MANLQRSGIGISEHLCGSGYGIEQHRQRQHGGLQGGRVRLRGPVCEGDQRARCLADRDGGSEPERPSPDDPGDADEF